MSGNFPATAIRPGRSLKQRDYDAVNANVKRYRELLYACVEYDGERTFTNAEVDEMCEERYAECIDRRRRGLPLIEAHE